MSLHHSTAITNQTVAARHPPFARTSSSSVTSTEAVTPSSSATEALENNFEILTENTLYEDQEGETLDLTYISCGPASLVIAIALHDSYEDQTSSFPTKVPKPKLLILEKQPQFEWHSGMQLPGTKMQNLISPRPCYPAFPALFSHIYWEVDHFISVQPDYIICCHLRVVSIFWIFSSYLDSKPLVFSSLS
jgi:hypothetical protein